MECYRPFFKNLRTGRIYPAPFIYKNRLHTIDAAKKYIQQTRDKTVVVWVLVIRPKFDLERLAPSDV